MDQQKLYAAVLADARKRMSAQVDDFLRHFAPLDVAKLLLGAGVHVLRQTQGDQFAAEFMAEISDDILADAVKLQ